MNTVVFNIIFIISIILFIVIFSFAIAMIFSPKLRGKMMSRQIEATKNMVDYSKEDLTSIGSTMGNVAVQTKKHILDQNEDTLKDMATREANISKEGISVTAKAIKDGLTNEETHCQYCQKPIKAGSKYCSYCGKEQAQSNNGEAKY